jgi:hypothetical protein
MGEQPHGVACHHRWDAQSLLVSVCLFGLQRERRALPPSSKTKGSSLARSEGGTAVGDAAASPTATSEVCALSRVHSCSLYVLCTPLALPSLQTCRCEIAAASGSELPKSEESQRGPSLGRRSSSGMRNAGGRWKHERRVWPVRGAVRATRRAGRWITVRSAHSRFRARMRAQRATNHAS